MPKSAAPMDKRPVDPPGRRHVDVGVEAGALRRHTKP
jgi:hypothetical protein